MSEHKRRFGYVDDGAPKPLYTAFHRNTHQRDLIDLGLSVDPKTHMPATDYHVTDGNYDPAELPQPTRDLATMRTDLAEFGYCLVADALSAAQLEVLRTRLDEQAAGERAANLGVYNSTDVDGNPTNQFVFGLVNKGQCFRDIIELSERGTVAGPLIAQIMTETLGEGFICNQFAAQIAGKGGNPQALHTPVRR